MNFLTFLLAVTSVSLNAAAQLALKKLMLSIGPLPIGFSKIFSFILALFLNVWFTIGMGCYVLSVGIWLVVLAKTEVSLAYPLLSIGYIITAIIGYFFLHENVNLVRMVGIFVVCIGIIIISRSA